MNKVNIKELFFKCFVPEAAIGKITVFFNYSVAFNTKLSEYNKVCKNKINNDELIIPTLTIRNMADFNKLLEEYVDKAMNYYDDSNFNQEILNYKLYDKKEMICKEKEILVHLFANATYEDFNNPVIFLQNRINFIDNYCDDNIDLGYQDILGCNLKLKVEKDTINNETPSQLVIVCNDNFGNNYTFPKVKFGISNDIVYIYAIQNYENEKNELSKKINRKLYKIGEGFVDEKTLENPKDITASFLVVLNMAINYFRALGYNNFQVPSILPIRWNAKQIINNDKYDKKKIDENKMIENNSKLEEIQYNLTNKLIRTFLRLGCHYNNINITSFPYELDSALHVEVDETKDIVCNNKLLYETGSNVYEKVSFGHKEHKKR